ncbi:MAG: ABC transporter ATP-binding protein [Dehalococcoidia bacterium]
MTGTGHGSGRGGVGRPISDTPTRPLKRGTLRRVLNLYGPYRVQLTIVVSLVLFTAALGVVPPLIIRRIIDVALPTADRSELAWLVTAMVGIAAVTGAMNLWQAYLNIGVGFRVMQGLRAEVYRRLQRLPLSFFTSTRTGDIQSRLASDVSSTQLVLTDTIGNVISNLAIVASSIVAMLIISWQLSLVALFIVPVFVFFTVRVGRRRRVLTGETQRAMSELTARTGETLSVSGVLLAKTFGREPEQMEKFEEDNTRLTELSIRQQLTGRGFFVIVQSFFSMAPALVWLFGGWLITGGDSSVTVGDIVAFTTIQVRLLFPLSGLLNRGVDVTSSLALFERIFEYMDLEPHIKDPPNPVRVDPATAKGEVRFEHVRFAYPAVDSYAPGPAKTSSEGGAGFSLGEVDFTAPAGKLTALVGPSGSGKTTIGYLLARLYDVDSGAVLIDGINVRDMALEDLSGLIGVVSQEPFMFHSTIRENLLYGKPTASGDELVDAAKAAQIHDTISALPDGYDTVVGERGYRLSGGERQRMSIARVVLANPRILLLDEATSSLDTLSERLIQQALTNLMRGRTTIAIAHRLSTVIAADQILVMQGGRIRERGRHEELMSRSGLYRSLYEQQFTAVPGAAG